MVVPSGMQAYVDKWAQGLTELNPVGTGIKPPTDKKPAFNKKHFNHGNSNPWTGKVLRGRLRQRHSLSGGKRYGLNFLYNPSAIQVSYAGASDLHEYNDLDAAALSAQPISSASSSWNFDLLFDRMHEAWTDPRSRGVMDDVEAFERVVGIFDGQGPLRPNLVDVTFGSGNTWVNALRLLGTVTGAQISYSLFSHNMIPIRCSISISIERRWEPEETVAESWTSASSGRIVPQGVQDTVADWAGGLNKIQGPNIPKKRKRTPLSEAVHRP